MLGSASAIALSPLSAIALDGSKYTNARLGIELRKPDGWHFVSVRDFELFSDAQADATCDKELTKELREISGSPILVSAQHVESPPDVTPAFVVYANPLEPLVEDSLLDFVRAGEAACRRYLPGYHLEQEPSPVTLQRFDGAVFQYRYMLRLENRRSFQFRCRYLIVRTSRAEFCIPFECPVAQATDTDPEFDGVLASLRFW
jgi:hypothetical protein